MKMIAILITLLLGWYGRGLGNDAQSLKLKMIDTAKREIGKPTLTQTPQGLLIQLNLSQKASRLSPGTHAFHIHETGKCEPPFKSAGGHFNPSNKQHGLLDKNGNHVGDLPNIYVTENAPLTVEYIVQELSLTGGKASLLDRDGSALVIHERADDYHTDPAGNAGDRVACGVIDRSG
jgi:Cu-Zn family superoxide dismutase